MSQLVAKRRILVPLMSLFLVCTRGWAQTIDTVPLTNLTGLQKQLTGLDQELRSAWDILRHGPPSIDDYCQAIGDHVLPTLEGVSDKVYASTKGLAREDAAVRRSIKRLEELRAASSGRVAATYDQMINTRKVRREHIAAARTWADPVCAYHTRQYRSASLGPGGLGHACLPLGSLCRAVAGPRVRSRGRARGCASGSRRTATGGTAGNRAHRCRHTGHSRGTAHAGRGLAARRSVRRAASHASKPSRSIPAT